MYTKYTPWGENFEQINKQIAIEEVKMFVEVKFNFAAH